MLHNLSYSAISQNLSDITKLYIREIFFYNLLTYENINILFRTAFNMSVIIKS